MKKCCRCKKELPFSDFYKSTKTPDRLTYDCRKCHNEYTKERLAKKRKADYKAMICTFCDNPIPFGRRGRKVSCSNECYLFYHRKIAWLKQKSKPGHKERHRLAAYKYWANLKLQRHLKGAPVPAILQQA